MPAAARRRSVPPTGPLEPRLGAAVRLALAVGLAGGACAGVLFLLPRRLQAHTDIVGSPTFANFNVDYYYNAYYLAVLAFPVLALGLFLLLTWVARRVGLAPPSSFPPAPPAEEVEEPEAPVKSYLGVAVRVAAPGAILGLEAAIALAVHSGDVWKLVAAGAVGYGLGVVAIAGVWRALRRSRGPLVTLVSAGNALACPAVLAGLLPVSSATQVSVLSTGAVHHYPWLPVWLAVAAALAGLVAVGAALSRARSDADISQIERVTVLLLLGGVGLFLLMASLPSQLGPMEMFHEGEGLVPARLAALGYFPWRDVLWAHGLMEDTYRSQLGMLLFDASRWGAEAGVGVILNPLYAVSVYLLLVYLFRRNWPFLLLCAVLLAGPYLGPGLVRFLFWPLVLLLLAALLNKPSLRRAIAFVAAIGAQAVITPEAAYTIPACAVVIIGYELLHRSRTRSVFRNFQRTAYGAIAGLTLVMAFLIFLASQHALGDFLFYYRAASEGHALTGGLGFSTTLRASDHPLRDVFAAIAPPAALLVCFWYAVHHLRRRIPFTTADWVMGANAVFVLLYYQKFLARADVHVYQPFAIAVPLLLYIAFRLISAAEMASRTRNWGRALARNVTRHPLSLALLLLATLTISVVSPSRLENVPGNYRAEAAADPWLPALGYSAPGAVDRAAYIDVDRVVRAYLGPGETLFDFSNEPGLFYYLMANNPPTRYYHVSLAIPQDVQGDLVGRLRSAQPKLVVFTNDRHGLPSWDEIPNQVRHYDVSQYILDNYHPLLDVQSQLIMVKNGASVSSPESLGPMLTQPLKVDNLYFDAPSCDWGYTPNFFSVTPTARPGRGAVSVPVPASPGATGPQTLALPTGSTWTDYQWIEIDTGSHFNPDAFELSDGSRDGRHRITFKTLADSPNRYLVRVGNCIQWHGYSGTSLQLSHRNPQDISGIRLIP